MRQAGRVGGYLVYLMPGMSSFGIQPSCELSRAGALRQINVCVESRETREGVPRALELGRGSRRPAPNQSEV